MSLLIVSLFVLTLLTVAVYDSTVVVGEDETYGLTVFGEYETALASGVNFIPPFVSQTYRVARRQTVDVPPVQTVGPFGSADVAATAEVSVEDPDELFSAADILETPVADVLRDAIDEAVRDLEDGARLDGATLRTAVGAHAPGVRVQRLELDERRSAPESAVAE